MVPDADLELGSLRNSDPAERIQEWISRLSASKSPRLPAEDLYVGDAWGIIKPFGQTERLWIASAGYGLISHRVSICSYSATFTPHHPDSIISRNSRVPVSQQCTVWWSGLWKWCAAGAGGTRIADLARQDPGTPIIVILSHSYLRAIQDDLLAARELLEDPRKLIIVSAGSQKTGALKGNYIPCDARLQTHLKGARVSLNSRIARKIITETPFGKLDADYLGRQFVRLLAKCPVMTHQSRSPRTDLEVTQFINKTLSKRPASTATSVLNDLRSAGFACEQSRLKKLFKKVFGERV